VISKEGEVEQVCSEPATQLITLVDPDSPATILAMVLVCETHDQSLESGKALIAVSESGTDRIGIQYKQEEVRDDADAAKTNGA
jgi:hypothetical protein